MIANQVTYIGIWRVTHTAQFTSPQSVAVSVNRSLAGEVKVIVVAMGIIMESSTGFVSETIDWLLISLR